MELKIRIKEVKAEMLPISREMKAIIRDDQLWTRSPAQIKAAKYLDECGYVRDSLTFDFGEGWVIGKFRTESIRDATPEEVIGWHCMSVWDSCFKTKCFGVSAHVRNVKCPKNDGTKNPCPARDEWIKAKELLKGKEVIIEVVNEA